MEMTRNKLRQYRALKKEIAGLDKAIDKLRDQALDIPVVLGKVVGSSPDFPYIPQHYTVQMDEPKEADTISKRIQIKEQRKVKCEKLVLEIEQFIAAIPDSTDRQIFELLYATEEVDGKKMTQQKVSDIVGLEQSSVSKRITARLQLSYNS